MALSPVLAHASISVGSADTIALTRSNSPALIASMNAAAAAASAIRRFYLAVVLILIASTAGAQTGTDEIRVPPLGSTLTADALTALPSSGGNLFTLLDTVI